MEKIRDTKTGAYYRMDDGRIGYANHQYARISVLREGFRNNRWFSEPGEIGDRMYQINKTEWYTSEYGWNHVRRIKYKNSTDALMALYEYNIKNCSPLATYKRRFKELQRRLEFMLDWNDKTREQRRLHGELYNNGFRDGVDSITDKLMKLINNL